MRHLPEPWEIENSKIKDLLEACEKLNYVYHFNWTDVDNQLKEVFQILNNIKSNHIEKEIS